MEIFDVFTLNVPFIEFESNRSVESFKNTTHSSRFERGNENSDTPDVSSKSRIRARCINPTVFSFENSSFHSVVSLVDPWNSRISIGTTIPPNNDDKRRLTNESWYVVYETSARMKRDTRRRLSKIYSTASVRSPLLLPVASYRIFG